MCSIGKAIGWMDPLHFFSFMHDKPKTSRPSIAAVAAPVATPDPTPAPGTNVVPSTAPPEGYSGPDKASTAVQPDKSIIPQTRRSLLTPLLDSSGSGLSTPL